ncbi:unnamed protein product [Effrenium voratum]|uniref:Polyketide synthase n=1 Tax=Effrenium voratum TaxID=2562239 RepID=A0AA36HQI7_9DINO|nr:unnamed protein product [Effrenium voratum]
MLVASGPLAVPILALGGDRDPVVPVAHLATWQTETTKWKAPKVFSGGHFYLVDQVQEVMALLRSSLEEALEALPPSIVTASVTIPPECYEKLITEEVERWATKQPEKTALVDPNERVTYRELVDRARLLGRELAGPRFLDGRSEVVALLMPHGSNYVIAMLGIWYASGIMIVIEAHFPESMCKEICEEAKTAAAIASPGHAPKFAQVAGCRTLEMNSDWVVRLKSAQGGTSQTLARPDIKDVSILMMTSGTTGRPKTIACSHFAMHVGARAKELETPYQKDDCREAYNVMFVWEVMRSPLLGHTAYLLPDEATLDPQIFVKFLETHECSRTLTTPSLLATIMDSCHKDLTVRLHAMRSWFMCGEVLPMKVVHSFRQMLPRCKLVNDYSTWESGDIGYAQVAPAGRYEPSQVFAAAGVVIAPGVSAFIIDPETKKTLPRGLVGELYVGGPVLSYGYHGQPEATASKFTEGANPEMVAMSRGSWKWYKTGDAARFVGDPPVLEIRGRIDSTVKIRGFKVGIPVVEGAIASIPGVALCAVVPVFETPTSVDSLLCFLKPQDDVKYDDLVLRVKKEAVKEIPRWMMPSYFKPLPLDCFMGGESRKLNRRRLSELADLKALKEAQQASQPMVRPPSLNLLDREETSVRGNVKAVWAKVLSLSIDMVDPEENFFDLGGHSALAAKMATELSGEHHLPVSVLDIYSHSTLQALCDFVESKVGLEGGTALLSPTRSIRPVDALREAPKLAVAGISGRFPGADSVEHFWDNIVRATVSATFLSKDFLRGKGVPETTIGHKDFVPAIYMINDADKFDNVFFGIGRHEASMMDPQHRVFIQEAWAAMDNAALPPKSSYLSDKTVGVFAAAGIDGYLVHHLDGQSLKDTLNPQDIFLTEIGNEKDYIATRVSYLMDFSGPSMNVNSACSSALVAVVQAAHAIAAGQCDAAIAGASSITFPNLGYLYADGLVSSVDGYVRPFDAKADGTVFGDSVGALVLRRQEDIPDTGLAYASLKGFAVSNDGGQKAGYAAPSSNGQAKAVQAAMRMTNEDPWSISYVECHCTGTRIGDGIEMHGLVTSFETLGGRKAGNDTSIALGSVKGNIAHANCAAGATGLIKALMMMKAKSMAPTANFKELNPKINLKDTPFFVNSEVCPWTTKTRVPMRAGVSSFGIGGTNAHTIVEEVSSAFVAIASTAKKPLGFQLLPFSAKTPGSLRKAADKISGVLNEGATTVDECAYTLQAGRSALPLRKTLVVPNGREVKKAAQALQENFPELEELEELDDAKKRPPVAFVFPGQGSQYLGMARGLYEQVPLFQKIADQCCEILASPKLLGNDLRPLLFGDTFTEDEAQQEFEKPSVMQPALFMVEYALSQALVAVDIKPVACAGHSLGEYAAAVVGGFLTLESALQIVATRARSTETLADEGAMLSVADWSTEELEEVGAGQRPGLWLAAVNSPQHSVISGEVGAIEALEKELKAAGKKCGRLHVKRAFHSGLIAKAADTLRNLGVAEELQGIQFLPVASNMTGQWLTPAHMKDGKYWQQHMRGTVLWRENAERLISQWRPAIVLEVGPGNVLSTLTSKCVQPEGHKPEFLQCMRHPKAKGTHDVEAFLGALGKLWEAGCNINWDALHSKVLGAARPPMLARLPAYSFEPTMLWVNPERSVYVDATQDPEPSAYVASQATASSSTSRVLVRYGEERTTEPSLRAYCLPFASGSSLVFAPWAKDETAVEIVSVELPGRGSRSEEVMPSDDSGDGAMLEALINEILADLRGCPYVLVGFSMGGGFAMELALRISERQAAPLPLGVYVAGRKPPAQSPAMVPEIHMSNEELAAYAFAPPEAAASPEFQEHVVPLLRADLEADARAERRLAARAGKRLPPTVGVELFCGTSDTVAPWTEAPGWQRYTESMVGLHYFPGGHEFMQDQRPTILSSWRRDAIGRLVQRRTMEAALLAAQGFGMAPGIVPAAPKEGVVAKPELPLYAVQWEQAPVAKPAQGAMSLLILLDGKVVPEGVVQQAVAAARAGAHLVVACLPTEGVFQSHEVEVQLSWHFVRLVQQLLESGVSAKLLVVTAAAATGAMVAGASKAVAMEDAALKIQRVFVPQSCLQKIADHVPKLCAIAEMHGAETDIWLRDASLKGVAYVQRLQRMPSASSKMPCVRSHCADGELARYVLTGATGGLGKAVVAWLLKDQAGTLESVHGSLGPWALYHSEQEPLSRRWRSFANLSLRSRDMPLCEPENTEEKELLNHISESWAEQRQRALRDLYVGQPPPLGRGVQVERPPTPKWLFRGHTYNGITTKEDRDQRVIDAMAAERSGLDLRSATRSATRSVKSLKSLKSLKSRPSSQSDLDELDGEFREQKKEPPPPGFGGGTMQQWSKHMKALPGGRNWLDR